MLWGSFEELGFHGLNPGHFKHNILCASKSSNTEYKAYKGIQKLSGRWFVLFFTKATEAIHLKYASISFEIPVCALPFMQLLKRLK